MSKTNEQKTKEQAQEIVRSLESLGPQGQRLVASWMGWFVVGRVTHDQFKPVNLHSAMELKPLLNSVSRLIHTINYIPEGMSSGALPRTAELIEVIEKEKVKNAIAPAIEAVDSYISDIQSRIDKNRSKSTSSKNSKRKGAGKTKSANASKNGSEEKQASQQPTENGKGNKRAKAKVDTVQTEKMPNEIPADNDAGQIQVTEKIEATL